MVERARERARERAPVGTLPGEGLEAARMPGHWLLARLGKRVLRPGGLELSRRMVAALAVGPGDSVVEFAPGLGATARITLDRGPSSYTGVERDEAAARRAEREVSGRGEVVVGDAAQTGMPDGCASVVYGEAMLTMQREPEKRRIAAEAYRLLAPGGRYGIHELCVADGPGAEEVGEDLSREIHVGARPLTREGWRVLLEEAGFEVSKVETAPMRLLEPRRLVADEGLAGALRFVSNVLSDAEARRRVLRMRAAFRRNHDRISAIALVARKPGAA